MDQLLVGLGFDPHRRSTDRSSEIHFRRLRAWAEVVQDPDSKFLEGMAATGVPLGARGEIPWVSSVYNKREKKEAEDQPARWEDSDLHEFRGNYTSAKEHIEKVRAHVESDLEKGWTVKVTLGEAKGTSCRWLAVERCQGGSRWNPRAAGQYPPRPACDPPRSPNCSRC